MNRLIDKILNEAKEMNDDPFFQPKNIEERGEERRKEIIKKIKLGLQNIRKDYKNKDWDSLEEKLFLKLFSKFYLSINHNKIYDLRSKNDKIMCGFDLQYYYFWVSYKFVWSVFEKRFNYEDDEIKSFINDMLKKHFKLKEFTPKEYTR